MTMRYGALVLGLAACGGGTHATSGTTGSTSATSASTSASTTTSAASSSGSGGAASGSTSATSTASTSSSAASSGATTSATSSTSSTSATSGSSSSGAGGGSTLNPNAPPGTNFDLSLWQLQEPVGMPGAPTTISQAMLAAGYMDMYFFTDPKDGAMTFWDPENGVTTPNSNYPRSELREMTASGQGANWPITGTNTLAATVAVTMVPDHVCIGQIHIGTAIQTGLPVSTKPLLELYYYANGNVVLGIENSPAGGQTAHTITTVPLATKLSYVITLTGSGNIDLTLDGAMSTFTMPQSFGGYGMYFKAGDYDQSVGTNATVGAIVKFYALAVTHGP